MDQPKLRAHARHRWLLGVAVLVVAPHSFGQDAAQSAAQTLFEEGRALLIANRVAQACPKLAESQRLEPAPGTLVNLAICHEQEGKTASAYLEYNDLLALAAQTGDVERGRIATQRIALLQPLLARLEVRLPESSSQGAWVSVDGARLGLSALDSPIPVDPGNHEVEYGAPGMRSMSRQVTVTEPSSVTVVEFSALAPEAPPSVVPAPPVANVAATNPSTPAPSREQGEFRWLAMGGSLGVGVAGLAFGTYFGLDAKSEWRERNAHCHDGFCDAEAQAAGDRARTSATLSNVAFVAGIAGTVVGAYLLLSAPSSPAKTKITGSVASRHGGLRLEQEF